MSKNSNNWKTKAKIFTEVSENEILGINKFTYANEYLQQCFVNLSKNWDSLNFIEKFREIQSLLNKFPEDPHVNFVFATFLLKYNISLTNNLIEDNILPDDIKLFLKNLNTIDDKQDNKKEIKDEDVYNENELPINKIIRKSYAISINHNLLPEICFNNLGILSIREKKWKEGFMNFINALNQDKYLPTARYNLGFCYDKIIDKKYVKFDDYEIKDLEEQQQVPLSSLWENDTIDYKIYLPAEFGANSKPTGLQALYKLEGLMNRPANGLIESDEEIASNPFFGMHNAEIIDPEEDLIPLFGLKNKEHDLKIAFDYYQRGLDELNNRDHDNAAKSFVLARQYDPATKISCEESIDKVIDSLEKEMNTLISDLDQKSEFESAISILKQTVNKNIDGKSIISEEKFAGIKSQFEFGLANKLIDEAKKEFDLGSWLQKNPETLKGLQLLKRASEIYPGCEDLVDELKNQVYLRDWNEEFNECSAFLDKNTFSPQIEEKLNNLIKIAQNSSLSGIKYNLEVRKNLAASYELRASYFVNKSLFENRNSNEVIAYNFLYSAYLDYDRGLYSLTNEMNVDLNTLPQYYTDLIHKFEDKRMDHLNAAENIKNALIYEFGRKLKSVVHTEQWKEASKLISDTNPKLNTWIIDDSFIKILREIKEFAINKFEMAINNDLNIYEEIKDFIEKNYKLQHYIEVIEKSKDEVLKKENEIKKIVNDIRINEISSGSYCQLEKLNKEISEIYHGIENTPDELIKTREILIINHTNDSLEKFKLIPEYDNRRSLINKLYHLNEGRDKNVIKLFELYENPITEIIIKTKNSILNKSVGQDEIEMVSIKGIDDYIDLLNSGEIKVLDNDYLKKLCILVFKKKMMITKLENKDDNCLKYCKLVLRLDPNDVDSAVCLREIELKKSQKNEYFIIPTEEDKTKLKNDNSIWKRIIKFFGLNKMLFLTSCFIIVLVQGLSLFLFSQTSGILIFDNSGTMSTNDPDNFRQEAGKLFYDIYSGWKYEPDNENSYDSRIGLILMGGDASIQCTLNSINSYNETTIREKIQVPNSSLSLYTDISESITEAIGMLEKAPSSHFKFIILLTDGIIDPQNKNIFDKKAAESFRNSELMELKDKAITVYTIGLSSINSWETEDVQAGFRFLKEIAKETNGDHFETNSNDDLFLFYTRFISKFHPLFPVNGLKFTVNNLNNPLYVLDENPIEIELNSGNSFLFDSERTVEEEGLSLKSKVYGNSDYFFLAIKLSDLHGLNEVTIRLSRRPDFFLVNKDFQINNLLPLRKTFFNNEIIPFKLNIVPRIPNLNFDLLNDISEDYKAKVLIKQKGTNPFAISYDLNPSVDSNTRYINYSEKIAQLIPGEYNYLISANFNLDDQVSGNEYRPGSFIVKNEPLFEVILKSNNKLISDSSEVSICDQVNIEVKQLHSFYLEKGEVFIEIIDDKSGETEQNFGPILQDKTTSNFKENIDIDKNGWKTIRIEINADFKEIGHSESIITKKFLVKSPFLGICNKSIYYFLIIFLLMFVALILIIRRYNHPHLSGRIKINNNPYPYTLEELSANRILGNYFPKTSLSIGNSNNSDIRINLNHNENVARLFIDSSGFVWMNPLSGLSELQVNGNQVNEPINIISPEETFHDPVIIKVDNNEIEI